jgi:hypothetical protein
MVWMKEMKSLMADAKNISETQDIGKSKRNFIPLSKSMYELIKWLNMTSSVLPNGK